MIGRAGLVVGVVVIVVLVAGGAYFAGSRKKSASSGVVSYDPVRSSYDQDFPEDGSAPVERLSEKNNGGIHSTGAATVFKEVDGVTFEHFWPADQQQPSLSASETEVIVNNGGNSDVVFSSVGMDFLVDGRAAVIGSGTWEKFPNARSWERIEYINIGQQQYKGEPLVLAPGQKGKIHYHYDLSSALSDQQQQVVAFDLRFTINGASEIINDRLERTTAMVEGAGVNYNTGQEQGGSNQNGAEAGPH